MSNWSILTHIQLVMKKAQLSWQMPQALKQLKAASPMRLSRDTRTDHDM
jgi:hypothetical protein